MTTGAIAGDGLITRGRAPAEAVAVPRRVVFGGGIAHPLDTVVLLHLLFASADGRSLTPLSLWDELKAEGVRSSKDGRELVGKNSVYASMARLIDLGFVRKIELPNLKHPGRRGQIRYQVFENPAWNPDHHTPSEPWDPHGDPDFPSASPQVGTLPGTGEPGGGQSGRIDVSAGQNASPVWGSGEPGSPHRGSWKKGVSAGQNASPDPGSWSGPPPHPPGGGKTSSPYPLTPDVAAPGAAGGEEGGGDRLAAENPERLRAAEAFLLRLPRPWTAGRKSARELAPLLLDAVTEQGWDLDDPKLVAQLTTNTEGVRSYRSVLRTRIEDLVLREMVDAPTPATPPQPATVSRTSGPLPPHCGHAACDEYDRMRDITKSDGRKTRVPCSQCHPSAAPPDAA